MPRLIAPSRDQLDRLRTPLTTGERAVLEFFDRHLEPEWEIYVQPFLNGLRPDFVLLHPHAGIAVFEVKDWDLDAMPYFIREGPHGPSLWCRDGIGKEFRPRDEPVAKVIRYKQEILSLYCPRLGLRLAEQEQIAAVVTAGVIFTAATTAMVQALLGPLRAALQVNSRNERYHPLVGVDALTDGNLAAAFPWGSHRTSNWMTPELAADLRTWLVEPDHAAAQRDPLTLGPRQRELATTRTATGFRRVRGPAGCGKSLSLAARAAHLSAEGKQVLVVTYNLTLLHYLRDLAVRYPEPNRSITDGITWLHFHGWCRRVCEEAGLEDDYRRLWRGRGGSRPDGDTDDETPDSVLEHELPDLAGRAVDSGGEDVSRFDAVLVDEGQDFNLAWWNLLRRVLRPGGEMMLAVDTAQDLYERSGRWTDGGLENAGFRGGPWFRLEGSHRFPPGLVPHLRRFAESYPPGRDLDLPTAVQGDLFESVYLRWVQVGADNVADACVRAVCETTRAAEPAVPWSDVTLLVGTHELGLRCVAALEARGVRVAHNFGQDYRDRKRRKLGFWMGDGRMKASTVHSFKGWESRALVVHIARTHTQVERSAAYVAMSRLRRSPAGSFLTVVCSDPELAGYGRTWPAFEVWPGNRPPNGADDTIEGPLASQPAPS